MPTAPAARRIRLTRDQLHQISRALSDPTRFGIFQKIAASGHCVGCADLRENVAVSAPTISHHLKELEAAGLIDSTHVGKFVNLTLRRDIWKAYLRELTQI
jgi:ArsR family transcriptional regulator, arsenate/arsenite/antimonite-responsive transcriptional repressor